MYGLFFTKFINLSTKSWFLVHCVSQRARPINCIFMYCVVVSNNFCCSLTLMTYPLPTLEPKPFWTCIQIFIFLVISSVLDVFYLANKSIKDRKLRFHTEFYPSVSPCAWPLRHVAVKHLINWGKKWGFFHLQGSLYHKSEIYCNNFVNLIGNNVTTR